MAWSIPDALAEIERERGGQFDPQVVDALLRLSREDRLDLWTRRIARELTTRLVDERWSARILPFRDRLSA